MAPARSLVRVLLVLVSLMLPSPPLVAAESPGAVWVGETQGVLRIATAEGTFLGEIADVRQVEALAVDPVAARVWLYSQHQLRAYGLDGAPQLTVEVAARPLSSPKLAVDPAAGTVWLVSSKRLVGFDGAGQVIADVRISAVARSVAVDPVASLLWVASKTAIVSYDTISGANVGAVDLDPNQKPPQISSIAVDTSGHVWVATKRDLRRLAPDGSEQLRVPVAGLGVVVSDQAGGVWAARHADLLRIDSDGLVSATATPFTTGQPIVDLAVDGRDASVWAANLRGLARIEAGGGVSLTLDLPPSVVVRDLDLWRPPVPPSVAIASPSDDEFLATTHPTIDLVFTPGDQPVDPESLLVESDGSAIAVSCDLDATGGSCVPVAPLAEGSTTIRVTIADITGLDSEPASVSFTVDTVPPVITLTTPRDGSLTNVSQQLVAGSISEPGELTIGGMPAAVEPDLTFQLGPVTLSEGSNAISLVATDEAGNRGELSVTVTLDTTAPPGLDPDAITVSLPNGGVATVQGRPGATEPQATVVLTHTASGVSSEVTASSDGSFSLTIEAASGDSLSAAQTDLAGNTGPAVTLLVPSPPPDDGLPPDPATVAPALNRTVATDIAAATAFLYAGPDPIQTGVVSGTIQPYRAAVIRGRVLDRDGAPIPGVTISSRNHPEYGSTLTRVDGMFDLAVNGGGLLTVDYEKEGYLPAQRPVDVPWRDWVWAEDVALIPLDPNATVLTSGSSQVQVARGATVSDGDGIRTATLLLPAGTSAEMVLPDGSRQPLPSLTVRATEYTVGPSGPQAMPGPLPSGVGYTYAVELSADEAVAAEARSVELDQPAFLYVDNFLDFPVGGIVPAGSYDRQIGAWVGSGNGRVVEILDVDAGGLAELDLNGDGSPESAGDLVSAGFSDGERAELASLYPLGTELWRTPIPHLTPWDCNWPYVPPEDAVKPPPDDLAQDEGRDEDDPDCTEGSIIECQTQVLGESLPIVGTPYNLRYRSNRVPGRSASYTLPVKLSGPSVPASLKRIELEIEVAGQRTFRTFPALPDQQFTFTWDGKDSYGRTVQGAASVRVEKAYVYELVYVGPAQASSSWARFPGTSQTVSNSRPGSEVRITRVSRHWIGLEGRSTLGGWDANVQRMGGWSLDVHHAYDPGGRRLWLGDGRRRSASALPALLYRVAFLFPEGIAFGPDGSLYVAEPFANQVRKISPSGLVQLVAGDGTACIPPDPDDPFPTPPCGDGGPAVAAQLLEPSSVAVAPDGAVVIADRGNNCVRRVTTDGLIHELAGQCDGGAGGGPVAIVTRSADPERIAEPLGDPGCTECPATEATLAAPWGVAIAPDGSVYISDTENDLVRRVGTDGRIVTIAGGGMPPDSLGDGGPSTEAAVFRPEGLALAPDGTLFVAQRSRNRIRRITTDGVISTLAGGGFGSFCGDGGPSTDACLSNPSGLDVAPDGSLLIADSNNRRVRRISPEGIITTIAGGNQDGPFGADLPGSPATGVDLDFVGDVATAPDGVVYFTQGDGVLRASPALGEISDGETLIPDTGGRLVFVFDREGRHLRTVDALTGAVRYRFHYDARGLVTQIEDLDGQTTRIERDAAGDATAIVGPFGQRTELRLGTDGYLAEVENPAGEITAFTYSDLGLLETMTDPRGNDWNYSYLGFGRLVRSDDPAGGSKILTRTALGDNAYRVELTTGLGRSTLYRVVRLGEGRVLARTDPSGAFTAQQDGLDGSRSTTYPDGSQSSTDRIADPRWGFMAPVVGRSEISTPGGLTSTISGARQVTLTDPDDPLALDTLNDTMTVNGATSSRTFDASTKRFTFTSPEGRQRFVTLDSNGRPIRAEVPGVAPLALSYDSLGRLTGITQGTGADQRTMALSYAPTGWLSSMTDPLQRTVGLTRDTAGRVTAQTLPDGRVIRFDYDANGNVTSLTPPSKPPHRFDFTSVNLPARYDPPDVPGTSSDVTTFTFDLDRVFDGLSRPGADVIDPHYDTETGQLNSVSLPDGEGLSFSYDPTTADLASLSGPANESISYQHDGLLLTDTSWSGDVSGSVHRTHDANFRVAERTVNGNSTIAYSYDRDGLLIGAGDLDLTRNSLNGLLAGTEIGQIRTSTSYNAFGEIATDSATFADTEIYQVRYERDQIGRIFEKTETVNGVASTWHYDYDSTGRLVSVALDGSPYSSYSYDANSNRLAYDGPFGTAAGTYDDQDRLLEYGETSYTYSPAGALRTKTQGSATIAYDYDVLGNLRGVTLPDGLEIRYVVDGQGRRVGKKVGGTLVQGLLYKDRLNPVAELDGTGSIVARFVYGARNNVPAYMVKGGSTYRILSDQLGSVRLVVDIASGEIAQRLDYDPFGRVSLDTNPGFQPFGFGGGLYDPQTGLVRFGARDYDPQVGRWTAKDPVGFGGGETNVYGFVLSDPVNWIDSDGRRRGEAVFFSQNPNSDYPYHFGFDLGNNQILMLTGGVLARVTLEAYLAKTGYGVIGYGDLSEFVNPSEFASNLFFDKDALEQAFDNWAASGTVCIDILKAGMGSLFDALEDAIREDYAKHPDSYSTEINNPYFWRRNTTFVTFFKNTNRFREPEK